MTNADRALRALNIAREGAGLGPVDRDLNEADREECGAVYVTNTLGGMDVCVRPTGHDGRHDWRREVTR